jgi:hypothetical protein
MDTACPIATRKYHCICCCTEPLLKYKAFISEAFPFQRYLTGFRCFNGSMYLLEPKGGEGGRSVGLFYCLILSGWGYYSHSSSDKLFATPSFCVRRASGCEGNNYEKRKGACNE